MTLLPSFLAKKWLARLQRLRHASARLPSRHCVLRVELLEDRTVPAGLVDDVPAGTVHQLLVNPATPTIVHTGSIDYAGDVDVYRVTFSLTGQATIVLDNGLQSAQTATFLVRQGQSIDLSIFNDDASTGNYKLSIKAIQDDHPDFQTTAIALNPATDAASLTGRINYADDADYFQFTATATGTMTVVMRTSDFSSLRSTLLVSSGGNPVATSSDYFVTKGLSNANVGRNHILQFQAVQGQTYSIKASGLAGTVGTYDLLISTATDDPPAAAEPTPIPLAEGNGSLTGKIQVPGDQDLFQFTATETGYMIIQMQGDDQTNVRSQLTLVAVDGKPPVAATTVLHEPRLTGTGTRLPRDGDPVLDDWTDDILIIQVVAGQTYQLRAESAAGRIGEYDLQLSTSTAPFSAVQLNGAFRVGSTSGDWILDIDFAAAAGPSFVRTLIFQLPDNPPPPGFTPSQPTASRLAISNSPAAGTTTTSGTTQVGNALVSGLLRVAVRDNAVESIASQADARAALAPLVVSLVTATQAPAGGSSGSDEAGVAAERFLVGGKVFEDQSGKGSLEGGDLGVAGEKIVLEAKQGEQFTVISETTTNAKGEYAFQIESPGEYRVRLVSKQDAPLSTPASYVVTVHQTSDRQSRHFGKRISRPGAAAPAAIPGQPISRADESAQDESPHGLVDRVFVCWDEHFEPQSAPADPPDATASGAWLASGAIAGLAVLPILPPRRPRRKPTPSV